MNKAVTKNQAGRGRRTGSPDTRELIRQAARTRFMADGYQAVTMRSVAAAAGVDVALVSYYFGSKQQLFAASLALPVNPADIFQAELSGDLSTLPERVLRIMLTVWDTPETGVPLRTIAASAAVEPEINRLVQELVGREIVDRLAERLGEPDGSRRRAAAFSTQVAGLVYARYLLALDPIASMSVEEVVESLAPALSRALRG